MKKITILTLSLLICVACKKETVLSEITPKEDEVKKQEFAIIIHGGAGTILKKNMTPEKRTSV